MNHYKYLAITFFVTTLWCVYVFFDYYADHSFLSGLTLYADYLCSTVFVISICIFITILKFTKYKERIKSSFINVFAAFSGIFLSGVYFLYLVFSHNVREFFGSLDYLNIMVCSQLVFGVYFCADMYGCKIYSLLRTNKNLKV